MRVNDRHLEDSVTRGKCLEQHVLQVGVAQGFTHRSRRLPVQRLGHHMAGHRLQRVGALQRGFELPLHQVGEVHRRHHGDHQAYQPDGSQGQLRLQSHGSLRNQQQFTRGPAAFQIAVGRGGVGQRVSAVNAQFQLAGGDPLQYVSGAPEQFVARQQVVAQVGARQVKRTLAAEDAGVERRH